MKKILLLVVQLTLISYCYSQNNFILAGASKAIDFSQNYLPDSLIIYIPKYTGYGEYLIDINHDGVFDFKFQLQAPSTAMGGNSSFCSIVALDSNKIAFSNNQECYKFDNSYYNSYAIAKSFNYGDSINENSAWVNSVYLNYNNFIMYDHSCSGTFGPDTTYIGTRVLINSSYYYGWIQLADISYNPFDSTNLRLKQFACNSIISNFNEYTKENNHISIYPNPATTQVIVERNEGKGNSKIIITNTIGQTVFSQQLNASTTQQLNITKIPSGLYFIKVGEQVQKFIKQ